MKQLSPIFLFVLLLLLAFSSRAQKPLPPVPASSLRMKPVAVSGDSLVLDTLSIVPESLQVNGIGDSTYRLDFVRSILYWNIKPAADSVFVTYRVFPYRLNSVVQRLNYDSIAAYSAISASASREREGSGGLFNFGNIQYNGSFGREISFGNNQDAVVNSNLNLQLNGMLSDSIEIAAAITDNNLPVQPDGNTQELNQFDQVFLQFKKKNWQLNLGDIDIRQKEMYFLNFYKRLQGISFQTAYRVSPSVQSSTMVSGSVAKGKFTRNVFQGLEGNQGPYRLTGANSEFFFIVLGGTERVFLDGEVLQRGEDQDYVINYNTAEVTFTPKRMITKDSRIQIEFEYADRNYLNANLFAYQTVDISKKLKIKVGAFHNSDAKNSTINQTLSTQQKQFLFDVGDSISRALYQTAVPDTFSREKVLYEKVYDTSGPVTDSFYRYSVDPATARYSLSFSELGQGNGNYVPDFNGANGKVFRFVAPVNGIMQGRFEPVALLVTPKKQQLISIGTEYQVNRNNNLKTEVALSNYDINTFSSKDAGDDAGLAAKVQYTNTLLLKASNGLQLISTLDLEHVEQKFKPIERFRQVEFTREWGLPLVTLPATEDILRLSAELKNKNNQGLTYQFMNYRRSDRYNGYQNNLQQTADWKGFRFNNQLSLTNFTSQTDKGVFLRPVVDISKELKSLSSLQLGFRYALEDNVIRNQQADSLNPLSFSFDTYTAYLKSDEKKKNKYGLTYFTRADKYPLGNSLVKSDRSYNVNVEARMLASERHQLLFTATYRKLKVHNKNISKQNEDQSILGRAEYLVNEWKGLITGNVLYEVGAGQEQKRDFAYLEVPAGQGEFTWIDYNGNGVQELNEFEVAQFRDQALFIRIFVPSNEFVKAAYTTLNYSFTVDPKAVIGSKPKKFGRFVSRFTWQTSLQKNKKSVAKGDFQFNPFEQDIRDTALITLATSFANTLSFNRTSPKWGMDVSNLQNTGKSLLTYGYESRELTDWTGRFRFQISRDFTFYVLGKLGQNNLYSPIFENRNYELEIWNGEPQLTFIRGTVFRLQSSYKLEQKKNSPVYGGQVSLSQSLNTEAKFNVLQKSSINARFTFNTIQFDHPANTTVSYIMLDGLQPGKNFLWMAELTKRLLNNVELNFQYDGRKPAGAQTVHTGRASLRAIF